MKREMIGPILFGAALLIVAIVCVVLLAMAGEPQSVWIVSLAR